jgi:hypothetical protein
MKLQHLVMAGVASGWSILPWGSGIVLHQCSDYYKETGGMTRLTTTRL